MTFTRNRRAAAAALALAAAMGASLVAAPAAGAATATSTTSTGCSTGTLPSTITGRPAGFTGGLPAGYWIWKDSAGWHVRVTTRTSSTAVFSGRVTATDPLTAVAVRDEGRDTVGASADRRSLSFRLVNHGGVDGFDFVASCSQDVTFNLYLNGSRFAPTRIHLGAHDAHPSSDRFTISRSTA